MNKLPARVGRHHRPFVAQSLYDYESEIWIRENNRFTHDDGWCLPVVTHRRQGLAIESSAEFTVSKCRDRVEQTLTKQED